ncbi:hypothetical protein QWY97_01360 [Vibrio cortegadensis]|uniref:hypothetical protein n=1 Tax=Vibrio cortegadensis TaxID=1328770 RepID=UPI0021C2C469|nr:hypothetical protein [Vibrio cortegadensis]MDN3696004.1 hypothetical protein [Vibrio cortegadensis]
MTSQSALFPMRLSTLIFGVSCFFVLPSYAADPSWLREALSSADGSLALESIKYDNTLFDCGLEKENEKFCSDVVRYYKTEVTAEIFFVENRFDKLVLNSAFSPLVYSDLQLNLRKDGYGLISIKIGNSFFDVEKKLLQSSPDAVDKKLITFLNSQPLSVPRILVWRHKSESLSQSKTVIMASDSSRIRIELREFDGN